MVCFQSPGEAETLRLLRPILVAEEVGEVAAALESVSPCVRRSFIVAAIGGAKVLHTHLVMQNCPLVPGSPAIAVARYTPLWLTS
mmetsp:Transcript_22091/g.69467  ORF Transcript_22091/g.69467 Transcript_22091/m.69467 type:complete len:85 (-) Transcript_22091:160-414(-)